MSKKPDNVSDNPGLLPYASNVGAPAIKVTNIEHWKEPRIINVNQQFEDKFLELKKEYEKQNSRNICDYQQVKNTKLYRL